MTRPLTEYDNQVLRKIAHDAKHEWTESPRTEDVASALRHLSAHKMIVRKPGAWWMVRPTAKAWQHLEARKTAARTAWRAAQ